MLWRVRVGSFLAGFAVASGFALIQIRQDVINSSEFLSGQVRWPGWCTVVRAWCTMRRARAAGFAVPHHPAARLAC
jgi:hypothetical protein